MRGNPEKKRKSLTRVGSIPAYAGEPQGGDNDNPERKVYPRVCGGTVVAYGERGEGEGLSPRMRGNPSSRRTATPHARSIPAYAGEPRVLADGTKRVQVYPRVCGGTSTTSANSIRRTGLSPRMRGNHPSLPPACPTVRSIPAYAGEPPWRPRLYRR